MADKAKNVVLNFKMDGQVEYANTLKQINAVMNTAAKEYKNHIAAMGSDATATDKLRAEKKKLEIQMDAAQKRTKMLSAEYDTMKNSTNTTTEQLTKMYGKLLDAENAETKLQQSLDRVNDGLTDQAIEAREAQTTLSKLKDDSSKLEAEQQKLTSAFNLQNSELGENATASEKVELAQRQLSQQMSLTERAMDNLEKQLDATKRIYGENSIEVMQMEAKLNDARTTVNKFEKSLTELEKGGEKSKKALDGVGKGMAAIGGAAPAAAIGGLVSSMEDYNATMARLNTNADQAGLSMDDVNKAFNEMQLASRDADSSVEGVSNLIAAGFDPTEILSATQSIAGAAIKWSDTLNVEGLSDAVQETIAGGQSIGMFDELLSRSGVNIEKFNEGLKKASASGKEQEYVLEQLTNLGLNGYLEKHKELNPEVIKQQQAQQEMTNSLSELSIILTPLVTQVAEFTTKIIEWANENPKLAEGIAIGAVAIGGLITVLTAVSPLIMAIISGVGTAGIAFGAIAAPIGIAVAAIVALVAIGVTLWKNWDTIKEKAGQLKDLVVNKFTELKDGAINKVTQLKDGAVGKYNDLKNSATNAVQSLKDNVIGKVTELKTNFVNKATEMKDGTVEKFSSLRDKAGEVMAQARDKILEPIEKAKDKISDIVEDIQGFFSKMKLKIPKFEMPPLPKFVLKGEFSLNPPSVPTIGIEWFAKGGIMTRPTVFGRSGSNLMAGGEAGPEAILPLNEKTLGEIGKAIAETMGSGKGGDTNINIHASDDANAIARATERALRRIAFRG